MKRIKKKMKSEKEKKKKKEKRKIEKKKEYKTGNENIFETTRIYSSFSFFAKNVFL